VQQIIDHVWLSHPIDGVFVRHTEFGVPDVVFRAALKRWDGVYWWSRHVMRVMRMHVTLKEQGRDLVSSRARAVYLLGGRGSGQRT